MVINEAKKIISEVAESEILEKNKKKIETLQIVIFDLAKEEYAVKIHDIQEIIEIPKITPIPSSPEFVSGILNLRGRIVVIVDLEKRFSIIRDKSDEAPKHIIILDIEGASYGIIVDRVKEVLRVNTDSIQSTPNLITSKIKEEYFDGVVVLESQIDSPDSRLVSSITSDQVSSERLEKKTEHNKVSTRLIIILNIMKLFEEKDLMVLEKEIKKTTAK